MYEVIGIGRVCLSSNLYKGFEFCDVGVAFFFFFLRGRCWCSMAREKPYSYSQVHPLAFHIYNISWYAYLV